MSDIDKKLDELLNKYYAPIKLPDDNRDGLKQAIKQLMVDEFEKLISEELNKLHEIKQVGKIYGNYKITERFRRIGKNTKYRVVCILCGAPMFRYSNKFKLPHKNCPAINYTTKLM